MFAAIFAGIAVGFISFMLGAIITTDFVSDEIFEEAGVEL